MKITKEKLMELNIAVQNFMVYKQNVELIEVLESLVKADKHDVQVTFSFALKSKATGEFDEHFEFTLDSSDLDEGAAEGMICELHTSFVAAATKAHEKATELGLELDDNV